MENILRTLIVPASQADLAREIAAAFGPGGEGMFGSGLSPSGDEPATHYASSGQIPPDFAHLVPCVYWEELPDGGYRKVGEDYGDPDAVYQIVSETGSQITRAQVQGVFDDADVSNQEPFPALDRMALKVLKATDGE